MRPVRLVLYLRQDAAQDAERRRHHATALPAVDALGQHVDLHRDDEVAPQRRRQPEAVVAEPTRIEADDEPGRADALVEVLEVRGEVGAAALLARLDEDEHAAVAAARRHQARHGGERRVAVVGRSPAVEQVALAHRLVRAEAVAPLAERRLLVHVAVDDDGVPRTAVVDEQHRGAARQRDDLDAQRGVLIAHPGGSSSAAAAMAPRSSQSGSKAGERHGMRVYSLKAGRIRSSQAASMSMEAGGHDSVIPASRSSDFDMDAAVCWPILGLFRKKACLSSRMSQVSVTLVPPSTGSSS